MTTYLDDRPRPIRSFSRFLVFAIVVILAASGLTARLFYLQVVDNGHVVGLSTRSRTVLESIPSTRGLIYDRNGVPLVTNVATFAVKLRPADLPTERRADVVARLSSLLGVSTADINATIDGNPGSTFDLVRLAGDVPEGTARLISEATDQLPGVEVAVEARRQYPQGPLLSQIIGYTGPVSSTELDRLKPSGYLPDDPIGKSGVEAQYEDELRGMYGSQTVQQDASGRRSQVLQTDSAPQAGDSLCFDDRCQGAGESADGADLGDERGWPETRRGDRHEPADG